MVGKKTTAEKKAVVVLPVKGALVTTYNMSTSIQYAAIVSSASMVRVFCHFYVSSFFCSCSDIVRRAIN